MHETSATAVVSDTELSKPGTHDASVIVRERESGRLGILMNEEQVTEYRGTGPYHRVFSHPGYSYVSADIKLPCNAVRLQKGETGYIYVGGWGVGPRDAAYDAGFQYSPTYGNYALMIAGIGYDGHGHTKWVQLDSEPNVRFRCGTTAHIEFYPMDKTRLFISALGQREDGGVGALHVIFSHPINGWPPDGGGRADGIILKRMTSIAQPSPQREAWNSNGSFFGHATRQTEPLIVWSNVQIGRRARGQTIDVHPWTTQFNGTPLRDQPGALDYPLDDTRVVHRCEVDCATEYDMIDLHR